ncbi:MAG: VOC family protein [Eubacteriales bacterium]
MSIKFTDLCLISNDVPRLVAFYENIFGVTVDMYGINGAKQSDIHSSINIGGLYLTIDSVKIADNSMFGYVSAQSSNNTLLCFNVDNIDAEYKRLLDLGVEMQSEPKTHPWGARSFQFKDPDGNIINFRSLTKEG